MKDKYESPCYECPTKVNIFCIISCEDYNDYIRRKEQEEFEYKGVRH